MKTFNDYLTETAASTPNYAKSHEYLTNYGWKKVGTHYEHREHPGNTIHIDHKTGMHLHKVVAAHRKNSRLLETLAGIARGVRRG